MKEESEEFHERVTRAYRELAKNEPNRVVLIDGRLPADTIENEIWDALVRHFPDVGNHQTSNINLQTS